MTSTPPELPAPDLTEQEIVRREKLAAMRAEGIDPYPIEYPRTHTIAEVRAKYPDLEVDVNTGDIVGVAGRVMLNRVTGKLIFATLRDGTGDLQVMISLAGAGQDALDQWKKFVDLGDHVGVTGEVITSKRGELSVFASSFAVTSKALHPLPEKFKGLSDPEARVRQRYVDLIVRPEAREMLYLRSNTVRSIRDSLTSRGFTEVETPMLQVIHGGANARPFKTHINAYDLQLYMRIAPELYLKRLLVGGIDKVFEINRNFRNEGADSSHNPEFTMLEMYEAYGDYNTMRVLTQQIIQEACVAAFGSTVARHTDDEGNVTEQDLGGDWPVISVYGGISAKLGEEVGPDTSEEELRRLSEAAGVPHAKTWNRGQIVLELYEHLLEDKTVQPTFYTDFPTDVSPLTKQHREEPRVAERWDLVAFGTEIGTAYSELNDPVEQRARLTAQSLLAAGGDIDAMQLDEDFLRALEHGMPPAGGQGMGIDRVLMMLTGRGIRDTILFPLVKPS
jgi:lysyl-tRNA synthetase class 2